jgi:ABC-type antimicrobial peptide transport system permease subunit
MLRVEGGPRGHVVAQVLGEASLLGLLGGLFGGLIGLGATVAVAVANDWTAVLPGWVLPAGPLLGAVTGLLAGIHPATQAGRMEPVDALRHS